MIMLLLNLAFACTPAQEFAISCRNYCYMSWHVKTYQVLKGKCHCSLPEDIEQKLNLVPSVPRGKPEEKRKPYIWENQ